VAPPGNHGFAATRGTNGRVASSPTAPFRTWKTDGVSLLSSTSETMSALDARGGKEAPLLGGARLL
jgi:hypothetical protein